MAKDVPSAALAVRSSVSLELWTSSGVNAPYSESPRFTRDVTKFCRAAVFSPDGRYLAWLNGQSINICTTADWKVVRSLPRPKACYLRFSPNGGYLMSYEPFTTSKDQPQGSPNMFVYAANTGECVFSAVQKKQSGWEPVWSQDESIMALMLGGEAFFYEPASETGWAKQSKRIGSTRNGSLSVAPNGQLPFVAFCVPGTKGGPSQCKIYKYPDLQAAQPVGFKSFFQADSVDMMWNRRGNGLLLLTSTDVDQTGASYYGKQALHYMSTNGESYSVQLSKEGSVHAVEWNPNSTEFCVVYGFMPAKATFYNLKCDATFEMGENDRNSIYYNAFGTLIILAGFGNLSGKVEIWDVQKRKLVSSIRAPDTTQLEWCPNGELFVTATTAPRLRVGNCFKVWHYSGALLHETIWPTGQELYQVLWQTFPTGTYASQPISVAKIEGIKSSQPLASTEPYRPPGARGIHGTSIPGKLAAMRKEARQAAMVEKKNSRRKNGDDHAATDPTNGTEHRTNADDTNDTTSPTTAGNGTKAPLSPESLLQMKRIRLLTKKLSDISKLKQRKEKGEHLEANQLSKITSELELQTEMAGLKLARTESATTDGQSK